MARKNAASIALPASRFRTHDGRAPKAVTIKPVVATNAATKHRRMKRLRNRRQKELRKHFNLHLLSSDVMGDSSAVTVSL